jgi:hypothetical protein
VREKYCWLVADKPIEQGVKSYWWFIFPIFDLNLVLNVSFFITGYEWRTIFIPFGISCQSTFLECPHQLQLLTHWGNL